MKPTGKCSRLGGTECVAEHTGSSATARRCSTSDCQSERCECGTIGDLVVGTGEFRGRVELGLRLQEAAAVTGVALDFSASYDGIGADDYDAVEGKAAVRVPLN
jgi:hypothetical protein